VSRQSRERARYRNSQNRGRQQSAQAESDARARYNPTPGAPPAAAPPAVGPPPPDPGLIAAQAQTGRLTGYADAQATFDQGRIQRDFGYGADGGVDPNNPYGKAALLERNRQNEQRGITNSSASAGQLYAGSTQNAQNAATFGYLADKNSLRNQYDDSLNQTSLNKVGAYANAGANLPPEMLAALKRALGQG
jgi:hypothetical protein